MFTVIDCETNGKPDFKKPADDPSQPRLAQLCMIDVNDRLEIEGEANYYVRPDGWKMEEEASAINGLTDDFLNEHGRPITEVLSEYQNRILNGRAIVAFNAQFDCKTMRGELRRAGLDDLFMKTRNVCVMRKSNGVILKAGGKKGWPSLAEARAFLNLTTEGAHKAVKDAHDALEVFRHLKAQGVDLTPEVHLAGDNNPAKPKDSPSRKDQRSQLERELDDDSSKGTFTGFSQDIHGDKDL